LTTAIVERAIKKTIRFFLLIYFFIDLPPLLRARTDQTGYKGNSIRGHNRERGNNDHRHRCFTHLPPPFWLSLAKEKAPWQREILSFAREPLKNKVIMKKLSQFYL